MSPAVRSLVVALLLPALAACAATPPVIPVDTRSVAPGTAVTRGGKTGMRLLGTPISVGQPLPAVILMDSGMQPVDLASLRGEVLLVNIVPSLDTQVCERQTHLLGETNLPGVRKITISRDLPFAQKRFADESGLRDILYLSDYRTGEFGRSTGLLVDDVHLLARSVMVVDREGVVRYLQVVPEMSHLPDLETAFARAQELASGNGGAAAR